jgi:hypothetical protein
MSAGNATRSRVHEARSTRRGIRPVALIALAALALPAAASQWRLIVQTSRTSVFISDASVAPAGQYRKAWTLSVHADERTHEGRAYRSSKILHVIDCKGRRMAMG